MRRYFEEIKSRLRETKDPAGTAQEANDFPQNLTGLLSAMYDRLERWGGASFTLA